MPNRQQREQHRQAQEHELQHTCGFQRAEEHEQRKNTPQAEIHAEEVRVRRISQAHFRHQKDSNQRQPEAAVGGKSGQAKGVAFFVFQQAGKNLRNATVKNAHRQDSYIECEEAAIRQIKQNSGHAEAHKAQRCRISQLSVAHNSSKLSLKGKHYPATWRRGAA